MENLSNPHFLLLPETGPQDMVSVLPPHPNLRSVRVQRQYTHHFLGLAGMYLVSREIARLHHPMSSFRDLPVGMRLGQPEVGSYQKDRGSGLQMPLSLCSFQVMRVDIRPVLMRVDMLLADKDIALPAVPR